MENNREINELQGAEDLITITKVKQFKGIFKNENGNEIPYNTVKIYFTIGNEKFEYDAKVNRLLTGYMIEALERE